MGTAIAIVCAVVGGIIALCVLLRAIFALARKRLRRKIAERFNAGEIVASTVNANYFGLASKGGRQVRGNCALVLTRDVLWSHLAVPAREISIHLADVRNVSLRKSHCGRSVFLDLLRVDFAEGDREDAVAWYVQNPEEWKKAIENPGEAR